MGVEDSESLGEYVEEDSSRITLNLDINYLTQVEKVNSLKVSIDREPVVVATADRGSLILMFIFLYQTKN
jgi:hypothetical protein